MALNKVTQQAVVGSPFRRFSSPMRPALYNQQEGTLMAIFDLFSKRQKALRGDVPDVYTYDDLPNSLRALKPT